MAGASGSTCRTGPHLARETRRLSWALKIYNTSPGVRGVAHWASALAVAGSMSHRLPTA